MDGPALGFDILLFPGGITAILQVLDQIFGPIKRGFRKRLHAARVKGGAAGITNAVRIREWTEAKKAWRKLGDKDGREKVTDKFAQLGIYPPSLEKALEFLHSRHKGTAVVNEDEVAAHEPFKVWDGDDKKITATIHRVQGLMTDFSEVCEGQEAQQQQTQQQQANHANAPRVEGNDEDDDDDDDDDGEGGEGEHDDGTRGEEGGDGDTVGRKKKRCYRVHFPRFQSGEGFNAYQKARAEEVAAAEALVAAKRAERAETTEKNKAEKAAAAERARVKKEVAKAKKEAEDARKAARKAARDAERVARGLAPWGQGVTKKKKTSHPSPPENSAGGVADGAPGDAPAPPALGITPEDNGDSGEVYAVDMLVVLGTD